MTIEQIKDIGPILTGLLWPLAVIVIALVIRGIIRRGGVSSISAPKEGVVIGMNPVDTRANYQHYGRMVLGLERDPKLTVF